MFKQNFDVFGQLICIVGEPGAWQAFYLGNEGKRRPADFVIPRDLPEAKLDEYLADLFHEFARAKNNSVRKVP